MKIRNYIVFILALSYFFGAEAKDKDSLPDVNQLFELSVDSIEREIIVSYWSADTSFYVYYRVKNISEDTQTYITNFSTFFGQCILVFNKDTFALNKGGNTSLNVLTPTYLKPGESYQELQEIRTPELIKLPLGGCTIEYYIPLVKIDIGYQVNGRTDKDKEQYLFYKGNSVLVENYGDE